MAQQELFDEDAAEGLIKRVVRNGGLSIRGGMEALVRCCSVVWPGRPWDRVLSLDYEGEQRNLECWLEQLLTSEPPPESVNAYYFGIFDAAIPPPALEVIVEAGPWEEGWTSTMEFYICGSDRYKPGREDSDWYSGPVYFPEGRQAGSVILDQIHQITTGFDEEVDDYLAEHIVLGLGYVALAVRNLCRTVPKRLLLRRRERRAVALSIDEPPDAPIILLDDLVSDES